MMKRLLAMCLTLAMLLTIGVSTTASAEKEKLILLMWGTTSSQEKLRDLIFEQHPELAEKMDLEFVIAGSNDLDTAEKFRLSLLAGNYIADIIMLNSLEIGEFAETEAFVDMRDLIEANQEGMLPSAIECIKYGDYYAGIPQHLKHYLWYYNKTMFDAAGIDPSQVNNVDDLIEASNKLKAMFPDTYLMHVGNEQYIELVGEGWARCSAHIFDENGDYVFNTDPAIRAVLEDIKKLKDNDVLGPIADWTPEWNAGFANRQIASTMRESWFSTFGASLVSESEDEWAVAIPPAFGNTTERTGMTRSGAQALLIPKTAKNVELAKEYISNWITYADSYTITEKLGQATVREDVLKAFADKTHSAWGSDFYKVTLAASQTSGRPELLGPKSSAEQQIIGTYVNQFMNGEIDLDTMLEDCNNDLEMQLGNALH